LGEIDQIFTVVSAEQVARYLPYLRSKQERRKQDYGLHVRAEETTCQVLVVRLKFCDGLKAG